jgi:putative membrane protein
MKLLETLRTGLIVLIAVQHLYFLWLEMFAWTSRGPRIFRQFPSDLFEPTKNMAANQGLYNGFLSAGLIWSALIADPLWSWNVGMFFGCCVAVAGIYGGYSVHRKIFLLQGIPALLLIVLLLILMP